MRDPWTIAVSLLLLCSGISVAPADPPSAGGGSGTAASPPAQGGFFSSLKQAFNQDIDHEVVWGHFDVGSPPDTHRFYCLVNPKTGKREPNGVAGEPFARRDGMTGLKQPAVSPTSCAEAEQKGILVTADYTVKGNSGSSSVAPAQKAASAAVSPSATGPAPGSAPGTASPAAAAPAPAPAAVPVAAVAGAAPAAAAASIAPTMSNADRAEDRAYIRKAESDWGESEVTRDAGVLERILSEDFVGVDIDGTHYSKSDALQEYRSRPSTYLSNRLNAVEIRFYGQTAIAQGDDSWQKKDGTAGKHVWTDTWIQRNGRWQLVASEDLVPPASGFRHP
jgi:Domain of unknown function (DUF4440)